MNTKRTVYLGLLTATAMILHIIEAWLPVPMGVPGIKLGLANCVSLFAVALLGVRSALYITCVRIFLGSIFGGVFLGPAFVLSAAGGVGSVLAMGWVCRWQPPFSIIGVSVIGAVTHSIVQVMTAAVLVSSSSLIWYSPYVMLFAIPVGITTGFTSGYFLARVPQ